MTENFENWQLLEHSAFNALTEPNEAAREAFMALFEAARADQSTEATYAAMTSYEYEDSSGSPRLETSRFSRDSHGDLTLTLSLTFNRNYFSEEERALLDAMEHSEEERRERAEANRRAALQAELEALQSREAELRAALGE